MRNETWEVPITEREALRMQGLSQLEQHQEIYAKILTPQLSSRVSYAIVPQSVRYGVGSERRFEDRGGSPPSGAGYGVDLFIGGQMPVGVSRKEIQAVESSGMKWFDRAAVWFGGTLRFNYMPGK